MRANRVPVPLRAAVALAAAALAAGGILATATAVSAAPNPRPSPTASPTPKPSHTPKPRLDPTELRISNKVIAHNKHHADAITGVLTSDDVGLAGETVTLMARTGVKPRWVVVATGTTGTNGTVTFTVSPKVKTQYQIVFAGDSTHKGSESNVITLRPVKLRRPGPGTTPARWR